jgi:hypothetical protein
VKRAALGGRASKSPSSVARASTATHGRRSIRRSARSARTYRVAIHVPARRSCGSGSVAQPSALYAGADELADFGAPQSFLDIAVAQVSATVGEGFEARARVAVA